MTELYRELILTIMNTSYVESTKLDEIDPTNGDHYLSLDEIYLGLGARQQLNLPEVSDTEKREFKENCRQFIVAACVGIRKRYSLDDQIMNIISKLKPEICTSLVSSERFATLSMLFDHFPRLCPNNVSDQQTLDDEWRWLKCNYPKLTRLTSFGTR